jgi:trans-aconitate methyltransferase
MTTKAGGDGQSPTGIQTAGPEGWSGSRTVAQYDSFARRFSMYRATSADLIEHLGVRGDAKLVDIACGTGVSTQTALQRLNEDGVVWAVDSSEPMLSLAQTRISDHRVRWRLGRALDLERLTEGDLDHAVCNSAIWQLGELFKVFAAVRSVLRRGGQFACNWAQSFVADTPPGGLVQGQDFPLLDVARRHGLVDESDFRPYTRPSAEEITSISEAAGFEIVERWWLPQTNSPEATYEWWKVPAFSDWFLGHVPQEQRLKLVDEAWALWNPKSDRTIHWFCIRIEAV